ncbi:MAG: hypothetical protein IJ267_06420 [Bacteroidales bacterium]|nr:hypothetical protein [Bacteroidales bacterium]
MKRILIILITALTSLQLAAQSKQSSARPELSVELMANKDYSYYVGTWRWTDSTSDSEFVIKLEITQTIDPDWTIDYLKGAYRYKKNGVVVADYMEEINKSKQIMPRYPIYITADSDNNMELGVRDFELKDGYGEHKHHGGSSYIKYISDNPQQIKWVIIDDRQSGSIFADEKMIDPPGISLPADIIMTKVEE